MADFFVIFHPHAGQYQAIGVITEAADGTDANGLASIKTQLQGKFTSFPLDGTETSTITRIDSVAVSAIATFEDDE